MKISVVTAVYNNRSTIAQTIESVMSQTYRDVEHIIVDGGSTDGTVEVVNAYASRLGAFLSEDDEGIYDALNKGLAIANGAIVGFLNSDDVFADALVLERIVSEFRERNADAVYGDLVYVRKNQPEVVTRTWKSALFSTDKLMYGWMPPHPTFYAKRNVYSQVGGFNKTYRIAADYDCMLRILTREGINLRYIPHTLVRMRSGGVSNGSLAGILRKMAEDYRAIKENQVGGAGTLAMKNLRKISQYLG